MRYHLFYVPSSIPDGPGGIQAYYGAVYRQAEYADAHPAWTGLWISEHHAHPYGGIVPCNVLFGAGVTARTERLRFGTGIAVLPFHRPVNLAERVAMLDQMSGGRVDLGIGRGFLRHEYDALGVPIEESWTQFLATHQAIRSAWTTGYLHDDEGKAARVLPRPQQRPHPPIWVAASRNRDTFQLAGRHNHGLLLNLYTRTEAEIRQGIGWYLEALDRHGHEVASARIAATQHVYVGNPAEVNTIPREAITTYLRDVAQAFAYAGAESYAQAGAQDTIHRLTHRPYTDLYPDHVAFGSPDAVAARLWELAALGVTDLLLSVHFGSMPWSASDASLQRFTEEVVPRLS